MAEALDPAPDPAATIRAFLSIALPAEVARAIDRVKRRLEEDVPSESVRWTPTEQIHLTLKFLGAVQVSALAELEAALRTATAGCGPLDLQAEGLGCFPNPRQPRVLWVGLRGDLEALQQLQARLDDATAPWTEKPESRPFHPHLTLGRVREDAYRQARRIGEVLAATAVPAFGRWRAEQLHLMHSQLSPQGARHKMLAPFPLGGVKGAAKGAQFFLEPRSVKSKFQ